MRLIAAFLLVALVGCTCKPQAERAGGVTVSPEEELGVLLPFNFFHQPSYQDPCVDEIERKPSLAVTFCVAAECLLISIVNERWQIKRYGKP